MLLLSVLFVASTLGVLHSYVVYPTLVRWAAARRSRTLPVGPGNSSWPPVTVVMAVHNEATVLPEKLRSLAAQDYPGPLHYRFGSDVSTDATDRLLEAFCATRPAGTCTTVRNAVRRGKPATVNDLVLTPGRPEGILLLTDASVVLLPDTIRELVRPMVDDPRMGVTDARVHHTGTDTGEISHLEDRYIRGEVALKEAESRLFGRFTGPFGGCWALRSHLFAAVPDNYLVDDFYLCMQAYAAGYGGYSAPRAAVREGVGQRLVDEFRRKRRIGAGNWQNLAHFRTLWWPPYRDGFAFAFFSHKVLRWLSPLLLLTGAGSLLGLLVVTGNYWATAGVLLLMVAAVTTVPALRYFAAMNAALLLGLIDYVNGIETNVWQPSHRHPQDESDRDPRETE